MSLGTIVIDFLKHFSYFICAIKGHDINPKESLVDDIMINKRNWLCKCHRCNWYVMHDGATSGNADNCTVTSPTDIYPVEFYDQTILPASDAAKAVLYGK